MPPRINKSYKCCAVPLCGNTTSKTPHKLFLHVPNKLEKRIKWLNLARRDPKSLSPDSDIYFCEDHFDLPNVMENYMVYHVLGHVGKIQLKPDCVPSKFSCQPERISTGSEEPYIFFKKKANQYTKECFNNRNSHSQFHDTLKGKSTDTKMNENINVKCEKDSDFVYQVIKEEIPNDDGFDKDENETINKQTEKGTEGHKEVLGCISKVESLVNKKFAIAIKAQNYTFQLESIPLRNVSSETPNSQDYLSSTDRGYDGSLSEEGIREIKKETEDESKESYDDNFELDTKPITEDLSNTFTGQDINNYRDGLTNVKNEEDIDTSYLDIKPVLIQDVYDKGQELNNLISGNKLNNSMITDLGQALKTHSVTESSLDDISGIDTKPVIIHYNYDSAQKFNDLTRNDELSNFNTIQSGNTQKSHASEPKQANINDDNTTKCSIDTEEFHITRNKLKSETLNKRAKDNHQDISKAKINNPDILQEGLVSVVSKKGDDKVVKRKRNSVNITANNFNRNNDHTNDYLQIINHVKTKKLKAELSNLKKSNWNSDKTNKVKCNIEMVSSNFVDNKLKSKDKLTNVDSECVNIVNNSSAKEENSTEYKYSCIVCNFKTNSKKFMQSHSKLHSEKDIKDIFVCEHCAYITQVKNCLIKHMEKHTGQFRYTCNICSYRCKYSYRIKSHMNTHSEKTLSCDVCEYKCRHIKLLNNHMKTHTEKSTFECDFCQYKCTFKSYLVKHIRKHTGEKPFSCKICQGKFGSSSDLAKHVRIHSKVKPYSCNVCTYKTVDKHTLTKHMRIHTGVKPYTCKYCPYSSTISCSLRQHMNIHTGERPYTCNLCDYASKQQSALVSHMRTHTKEKPYQCNICDYRAVQKTHLDRHMLRHTGEKPFICDICTYKCSRKCVLINHMRIHTSDRPHSCKLCNYTCKRKSSLVLHERTHTGEKPFACNLCDFKCVRGNNLNSHMRMHSGVKS